MKKIITVLTIFIILFINSAQAKNSIYEIGIVEAKNGDTEVNLLSDYKQNVKVVKENELSSFFDIKNSTLSDNFKTNYSTSVDTSIVAQQIGSKVRIYLKDNKSDNIKVAFNAKKGELPFDYNKIALSVLFLGFIAFVAKRFYSVTMNLKADELAIKSPMKTAINLNRQLMEFGSNKNYEIVLNSVNTIKNPKVADFNYAKDRKNIKIAI